MPSFGLSGYSTTGWTLDGGETGFIDEGGALFVSANAVTSTGNANYLTVLGSIQSYSSFRAVKAADTSIDISVGQNGYIGSTQREAIYSNTTSAFRLDNDGTIVSQGSDAVFVQRSDAGLTIDIKNSGTITGEIDALDLRPSNEVARIVNTGEILADDYAIYSNSTIMTYVYNNGTITGNTYSIQTGTGNDIVVNHGDLFGRVHLSIGDDVFRGEHGRHTGDDQTGGLAEIDAGNGADIIFGGISSELLYGQIGNDFLSGGGGRDDIDGGSGTDIAYYGLSSAGVNVNLATGEGQGGEAEGDQLSNIENVIGSGFDDILAGDSAINSFAGSGGADQIYGYGGNDKLDGGAGGDILNGGTGIDEVTYASSFAAVAINLTNQSYGGGDATGDTLIDIEAVSGSIYDDTMTGSLGTDRLYGGAGSDTIKGFRGNDLIRGDSGADNIFFISGDGTDTFFDFENDIDTITFQGLGGSATVFATASAVDSDGDLAVDDVRFDFGVNGIFNVLNTTVAELSNDVETI